RPPPSVLSPPSSVLRSPSSVFHPPSSVRAPRSRFALILVGALVLFGAAGIHASPRDAGVPSRVREITEAALSRADAQWDDRAALLWTSTRTDGKRGHGVRPTSWYALGLLWRDGPGDHERAVRAFDAVLRQQLHEPG